MIVQTCTKKSFRKKEPPISRNTTRKREESTNEQEEDYLLETDNFNSKTDYWSLGVILYIGVTDNESKTILSATPDS